MMKPVYIELNNFTQRNNAGKVVGFVQSHVTSIDVDENGFIQMILVQQWQEDDTTLSIPAKLLRSVVMTPDIEIK